MLVNIMLPPFFKILYNWKKGGRQTKSMTLKAMYFGQNLTNTEHQLYLVKRGLNKVQIQNRFVMGNYWHAEENIICGGRGGYGLQNENVPNCILICAITAGICRLRVRISSLLFMYMRGCGLQDSSPLRHLSWYIADSVLYIHKV